MTVRLFVRNLNPDTTEMQLARFVSSACKVLSVEVPRDWETGRSFGYGFLEFSSEEEAERALTVFDGRWLGRRALQIERARRHDGGDADRPIPREADEDPSGDEETGWRESGRGPWADDPPGRPGRRRRGKHGSDRKRRHGTRRWIE